jgi:trehalose-6-phosphate synthase
MGAGERRRRLAAIRDHVREHDIDAWIDAQLRDLDEARRRHRTTIPG